MLGKDSNQIDMFSLYIYENLIPKNHLLVKVKESVDFSFVYDLIKDKYSKLGRKSKDPIMMVKILLLEYLYFLSDVKVAERIRTDVAFRWFLGLEVSDPTPDDTTISHFRVNRLDSKDLEGIFNEIVRQCIEKDLIKTRRYMIDTTDVAANTNYPSDKKLIRNAYKNVIKEISKFNEGLADEYLNKFEEEIDWEYQGEEKVRSIKHYEIAKRNMEELYLKTYDELQDNTKYVEAYGVCYDIIDQFINKKGDKIISVVDPDARVAHKSRGNAKRGYKNHIIVDEDSEIIVASSQTPFNVGDEKKMQEVIEKADTNLGLKPEEISADKVYGTTDNRAYLKDNEIISNIDFYNEAEKEKKSYGLSKFIIADDVSYVICPNGIKSAEFTYRKNQGKGYKYFKINRKYCDNCKLRDECLKKNKEGKLVERTKTLQVPSRYDAILTDRKRVDTEEFKDAKNNRSKVERRFATMVRNHGLRRCRYLRLEGAKKHITLANIACNIVRMVNLIFHPGDSIPQNRKELSIASS